MEGIPFIEKLDVTQVNRNTIAVSVKEMEAEKSEQFQKENAEADPEE